MSDDTMLEDLLEWVSDHAADDVRCMVVMWRNPRRVEVASTTEDRAELAQVLSTMIKEFTI